ncbi:hypothetical protein, partial [Fundicoccus ignavus]|uniref:hypothetical protein n=1 Tax=Fundicoccus ignavus TaxID=2664442 RepID=UPI001C867519
LSQWLGASLYLLAHLPHWVALFHASGGSNLRSSGSIYPQYSHVTELIVCLIHLSHCYIGYYKVQLLLLFLKYII